MGLAGLYACSLYVRAKDSPFFYLFHSCIRSHVRVCMCRLDPLDCRNDKDCCNALGCIDRGAVLNDL